MAGYNHNMYPQLYNPNDPPAPPSAMSYPQGFQGQPAPVGFGPVPGYPGQPGLPYFPMLPYPQMPYQPPPMTGYPRNPTAPDPFYAQPNVINRNSAVEWVPIPVTDAPALAEKAVVGGYEGYDNSPLWVIRAKHQGDLIPGKLAVKHASAYVPWDGKEHQVANIEVCCARPGAVRWVDVSKGHIPPEAIAGGHTAQGEILYIGRAKEQGSLTPGKVHPSHKAMYLSFAGMETRHENYQILVSN